MIAKFVLIFWIFNLFSYVKATINYCNESWAYMDNSTSNKIELVSKDNGNLYFNFAVTLYGGQYHCLDVSNITTTSWSNFTFSFKSSNTARWTSDAQFFFYPSSQSVGGNQIDNCGTSIGYFPSNYNRYVSTCVNINLTPDLPLASGITEICILNTCEIAYHYMCTSELNSFTGQIIISSATVNISSIVPTFTQPCGTFYTVSPTLQPTMFPTARPTKKPKSNSVPVSLIVGVVVGVVGGCCLISLLLYYLLIVMTICSKKKYATTVQVVPVKEKEDV